MISIIAAVAENGVIGRNNRLIWHLPADLKHFRRLTMGHHIIMGRKTYESIGRSLPGRITVLITRKKNLKLNGLVADSLQAALALCQADPEVFITGGGEIFRQALPLADRMYLTRIHHAFEGDAWFPEWNESEWERVSEERFAADVKNPYDYSFITLDRKKRS